MNHSRITFPLPEARLRLRHGSVGHLHRPRSGVEQGIHVGGGRRLIVRLIHVALAARWVRVVRHICVQGLRRVAVGEEPRPVCARLFQQVGVVRTVTRKCLLQASDYV